jgi:hypothetical protein
VTAIGYGSGDPRKLDQKSLEDSWHAVWAERPSPESGLTALAVDASTDDAARIQAMLNYLDTTYGAGGTLYLPPGTSNVNSGIILPEGVRIIGVPGVSRWDFWFAGTGTFTGLTVAVNDFTPISGLKVTGRQADANASIANSTGGTGLSLTGHGITLVDVEVGGWNVGVDLCNSNTFIITMERCQITGCMVGLNVDIDRTYRAGSAVTNSGERVTLTNSVIANCGTGFLASANGCGLFFNRCSIDFTNIYGRISNAHVNFVQCHLENNYHPTPSTNGTDGGAPARYLFDLDGNPRLTMDNCIFIIGSGIYTVVCAHKAPFNYGTGFVSFDNCNGGQGALHPSADPGAGLVTSSAPPIIFNSGETAKIISSLFTSRWNNMKASIASLDFKPAANLTARITGMSAEFGTIEVTLSGAAPGDGTWVEVKF